MSIEFKSDINNNFGFVITLERGNAYDFNIL